MRLGETDTSLIRIPIAIHDTSGLVAGGCSPGSGQLLTSVNGAAFTDAAGTLVNFSSEGYYYQGTVDDASVEGVICVCVQGVSGFRTEMAFQPVVGSDTTIRIPFVIYDTSGDLFPGFEPGAGSSTLETSEDGVSFVTSTGSFFEMGFGGYFYVHDVDVAGFLMLRAASSSTLTALAFGGSEIADCPSGPGPSGSTPVVTIVTSLPPATSTTPIVITVEPGGAAPIRRAWIDLHFPGIIGDEVGHNSARFGTYYTNGINTRTTTEGGGYQFTLLRDGGWPVGSFPLAASFDIFAVDTAGNST